MRNLRVRTEKDFVQRKSKRAANLERARIFRAMKEMTQKRVSNECLEMPQWTQIDYSLSCVRHRKMH